MRNELLKTISQPKTHQIMDAPVPKLLSVTWQEMNSGAQVEGNIQIHPKSFSDPREVHPTVEYTPRPEAWGINE